MKLNQIKIKLNFMSQEKQTSNEFRIGFKSNPKEVITQCEKLLKGDKVKEIHLSAVANSIGELTTITEILKLIIPGLSQKKLFSVISPRSSEKDKKPDKKSKRLYPRLEFILSIDEKDNQIDSPSKISEDEISLLIDSLEKQKESYRKTRKSRRALNNSRRWRTYSRRPKYSNPNRRTSYGKKKVGYSYRRPFGRSPNGRKSVVKKAGGSRKNSGNKQVSPVKN